MMGRCRDLLAATQSEAAMSVPFFIKPVTSHSGVVCLFDWSLLALFLWRPVYKTNGGVAILEKVFKDDIFEEEIIEHTLERVGGIGCVERTCQREKPYQERT